PRSVPRNRLCGAETPRGEAAADVALGRQHARARRPRQALLRGEAGGPEGAARVARDVQEALARAGNNPGASLAAALGGPPAPPPATAGPGPPARPRPPRPACPCAPSCSRD